TDQAKETVAKFTELLKGEGAEIVSTEDWGVKKLAYPIQKKTSGYYELIEFKGEGNLVDKLEVNFRRNESVIRFLTFKMDKYAVEYAIKRRTLRANNN
ncbi:MAG TPA: 30S ribosomal protein S6, partial [Porphyromonadaceae bacterium]|nr:30S ribosomal protein S6 [Porphyromonadaceae bacterium]